ncbi:hypothetical protein M758_UG188600 [Ceratodon purpureus]|nr:hypothetical protein M758_UG188600 [Ceratodon purpureus]
MQSVRISSAGMSCMYLYSLCAYLVLLGYSLIVRMSEFLCLFWVQDALMEALLCFGAASCSIEDTNLGTPKEQEIYLDGPIPWQSGKRQLWKESTITALFAAGDDVGEALAMAANSVGLKEMLFYEVEELEDCDWVLKVEVQGRAGHLRRIGHEQSRSLAISVLELEAAVELSLKGSAFW